HRRRIFTAALLIGVPREKDNRGRRELAILIVRFAPLGKKTAPTSACRTATLVGARQERQAGGWVRRSCLLLRKRESGRRDRLMRRPMQFALSAQAPASPVVPLVPPPPVLPRALPVVLPRKPSVVPVAPSVVLPRKP